MRNRTSTRSRSSRSQEYARQENRPSKSYLSGDLTPGSLPADEYVIPTRLIDLHVIETGGVQRERQAHASDPASDDGNLYFAVRANPRVAGATRLFTIVVAED